MTGDSSAAETFESFVSQHYPRHAKRLRKARAVVRFAVLKSVLGSLVVFGLPLSSLVLVAKHFILSHAASLQEGQRPIPFTELAEPAANIAIASILLVCTLFGVISGILKKQRFALQIERDELRLRSDFLLRELTRAHSEHPSAPWNEDRQDSQRRSRDREEDVVVRHPKAVERSSKERTPPSYPPLSQASGEVSEGPSVAGNDFADLSFIEPSRRRK